MLLKRTARWLLRLSLGLVLAAVLGAVGYALTPWLLTVERKTGSADVIVVLGGETPRRSARAAEMFQQGLAPHILVTGAGDASLLRRRLIALGVPATAISTEEESINTWENGVFTVSMLRRAHARKVCLVTSWYHSRRSQAVFRSLAPEIEFYSAPAAEDWLKYRDPRMRRFRTLAEEYAKLAWYILRYGIWPW